MILYDPNKPLQLDIMYYVTGMVLVILGMGCLLVSVLNPTFIVIAVLCWIVGYYFIKLFFNRGMYD